MVNVVLVAVALVACSAPLTLESLEDADSAGSAPQITNVVQASNSVAEVEWQQNRDARGWQLQSSFDGGDSWHDRESSGMLDEDAGLYAGSDIVWDPDLRPTSLTVRLRMVIDGNTVSPWAIKGPIQLDFEEPQHVSAPCRRAFDDAFAEARADAGETYFQLTLDVCTSVDEWVEAAQERPEVLGFTSATRDDAISAFGIACRSYPSRALCG